MYIKLRFYQGCMFGKDYSQRMAFDYETHGTSSKTILEWYLDGLRYNDVTLENVYYENSGEFVFELEQLKNPYESP